MASSHLSEELECSVCLNIYTDPVTLTCGHNFCRECIGRVLDTQEGSGGYCCPECRENFRKRPALQKNFTLCKILETLQTAQHELGKNEIFCTYCIHTPVPAVISCLHCEASLCDNHLRVHSKSPKHVLCDLTTSPENRKCSVHKKILEYYCTEDSACICVSCRLDGEHRGHQVETLDEASEKKKKTLRNVLQKLMTEREETEKRVQSLEEHRRKVQEQAAGETERVTALFRDLRRRLEDLEKRVLSDISGQAERISLYVSDMIQELEIKKDELSRKLRHIAELCNLTDPLTVLRESDTGDLCDTEDGDDEDRERHDGLFYDGGDLDVTGISHTLHTAMASADLRAELECSVCLNIYTNPVTLRCGHNFCRDCIGRVLDTQEGSGGYSCPECRDKFQERPALQRNITLRNIVENFLPAQPDEEESGVLCTHCIHTPVPAVKSCLLCEASLCDNHLRVHSKSPEHVLCDPATSLENRKCSVHKKILEYYCTEDSACICVSCRLDGEHRGHQVETLEEASEKKKKTLRNVLQKLMTQREETEKRVRSLEEHRRKVQGKAAGDTERVTALFRDLRRRLEDLEKRVLREISGQAERTSIPMLDMIRELEIKKDELSRKMRHIEELCNMTDPLTVIQESDTGDLCDTEDGDDEDRERHDRLLHDGGDLDVAGISHTLHTGISDIMSGVIVQEGPGTHVYPHSRAKAKGHINAEPSRPRPQPTSTVQRSHLQARGHNIGVAQQTLGVWGVTDILLDVNTAGNHLHISCDRKTATSSTYQNRPQTPERFQYPQVLSSWSFSSGRHYWEVDVGGSMMWRVGMCYPSIDRSGDQSWIGYNRKSWSLEWRSDYKLYSVRHDSKEIYLTDKTSSKRVRIVLDYEAGRISFYESCDPIRLLHTFTTTFTEPLHAALWVLEGCIKISGGNQM